MLSPKVMDKMPEAEVALRLAFFLIETQLVSSNVSVSIDGAQVQTNGNVHFQILDFLHLNGWNTSSNRSSFQGKYRHSQHLAELIIDCIPGKGDVLALLRNGKQLRAECKKGPLLRGKGIREYQLLREALGQLLTIEQIGENDILAAVVPSSPKFNELATSALLH